METYIDSFTDRVAKVENIRVVLTIESTLPLITTLSSYMDKYTIRESSSDTSTSYTTLKDEDYESEKGEERFITISTAVSPLTFNKAYIYYDKKYQDIIIVPNLEFLALLSPTGLMKYRGFRIGSGIDFGYARANQTIPNEKGLVTLLPTANSNISTTTKLVTFPGITQGNIVNRTVIEDYTDSINVLKLGERQPSVFIELGAASTIFTSTANLPAYLLYQASLLEYGLKYLGVVSTGSNKLYVQFRF